MDPEISVWMFQLAVAAGLAAWMSVAVLNNLQAFQASAGAIGLTMGMVLLREPPFDTLPLRRRAIASPAVHRLALLGVIALQAASALALLAGTLLIACEPLRFASASALACLNLGLGAFVLCWSAMCVAGLWFGAWIRQEGLLLTQLLLGCWGLLSFAVLNLPSALVRA
ncbi:DUF2165 family protein [Variovorax sp.]|uniref:DUF2165 family protein n=1 Tax=Variovorax sp. TaxID=1871043 RepID=UPI001381D0CE|nr:DUF2165 family protein [Variovorax sp.]KAF1069326.1 MAG: hypothetical protein GAK39_02748 [Variovorax sp.]